MLWCLRNLASIKFVLAGVASPELNAESEARGLKIVCRRLGAPRIWHVWMRLPPLNEPARAPCSRDP